jgi:hypothetical protein
MNYLKGSFRSPEVVKNVDIHNESDPLRKDALAALT